MLFLEEHRAKLSAFRCERNPRGMANCGGRPHFALVYVTRFGYTFGTIGKCAEARAGTAAGFFRARTRVLSSVVPAKAGTHTPFPREDTAYGSRVSPLSRLARDDRIGNARRAGARSVATQG